MKTDFTLAKEVIIDGLSKVLAVEDFKKVFQYPTLYENFMRAQVHIIQMEHMSNHFLQFYEDGIATLNISKESLTKQLEILRA